MEAAERLTRTWVATGQDEEIDATVNGIVSGDIKLLHVVQALGEYLTAEEDNLRNKGVEFLASVVGKCPPEKLNRQSVNVLVTFFTSKLEDTETIIPALKGILALTALPSFTDDDAVKIIRALFAHVTMKALVQAQRFIVYSIVDSLMAHHRAALKSLGNEFLLGYTNLADGEKDPRNLLIAFAIARVILIEFEIKDKIEDLFNITFCYFPITFKPPPDDPYGITSDDLKNALLLCLSGTPLFGDMAIPLLLEKLNAGSPATKRETLRTLCVSLPVYGSALARKEARKLWSSLKLEIFQPTDPVTEEQALQATQVLIKTIYAEDAQATDEDMQGLAKDACEECILILKEPEKSQAKPAINVLCAFMSTTPSVSKYTLAQAVPHLHKLFLDPAERPSRGAILSRLASLIAAARDSTLTLQTSDSGKGIPPLQPYKDDVLGALTVGLKTPSSARPAIDGLDAMVTTPGLLENDELGFVVQNLNDLLTGDADDTVDLSDINDTALSLLTTIATLAPAHISETTLPLLFAALPDQAPLRADAAARDRYWLTLTSLARLCLQPALFETLVVRVLTKLDLLCLPASASASSQVTNAGSEAEVGEEPTAAYAHALLTTLANVLAKKVERKDVDVPKYIDRLVPRLFNLFIYSALTFSADGAGRQGFVVANPKLLTVAGRVITLVVQTLDARRQETFVAALIDAYLKGEAKKIAAGQPTIPEGAHFSPFDDDASSSQKNLVVLFSQGLIALHKDVKIPVDDPTIFVQNILSWSLHHAESLLQRESAWHVAAAIINKRAQDLESFISDNVPSLWNSEIVDASRSAEGRRTAITAWTWVVKGLLLRSHPQALPLAQQLFDLFDDSEINWDAARAIGQVVAVDKVLTKPNHAVIKILYAQKYMSALLPRIIEGAKAQAEPQRQTAHLVALASLVTAMPKHTYAYELPTLLPLLLRGLDLPDSEIRANVIETFLSAAQGDVESNAKASKEGSLVSGHASTLVSTMLKNSSAREMPNPRVRVAALKYLAILPKVVRYDVLHPHKSVVLKSLTEALDDPKRLVRKEAVDARSNWYTFSG